MMAMTQPKPKAHSPSTAVIDWKSVLTENDRWLRTVVYARLGDVHAVDEVMQEVSLAAVKQQAPIHDPAKVAPWLYRLAVTQSLMYRRKMGRRRKLTDRFAERNRPAESDNRERDPLGRLLVEERRAQVRAAIKRLPKRDAELLMLKYTQDWSYKRIAAHLGLTTSAVEARLHRARARLRDELAAFSADEVER